MTVLCRLLCALLLSPSRRATRPAMAGFTPDDRAEGASKRLDAVLARTGPQRAQVTSAEGQP